MPYTLHPYQTELVDKARASLANGNKSVLIVSPPGSGKSVVIAAIAKSAADKGGHILFIVHRKELVEQITNTFHRAGIDDTSFTAMTMGKVANRLDKLPKPTLIITDESHHALAKTYRKIYDYYTGVPRLGFTATPWRLNGDGLGDVYSAMVEGPTVKWLIANHYLAPFHYYGAVNIDTSKLRVSRGQYTGKSMDDAFGKFIFGSTIELYRKHADGRQAIVYAYSVEFSKRIAEAFNNAGITAVHADSKTPKAERERIMADFKSGKIQALTNVDLISEGFDVPDCGVVIMLRPTKSLVMDLQQGMRGMRYRPGKTSVIIDQVGNFKEHGLPDDEQEWNLDGRPKRKKETGDDKPLYTCERCLASFREWTADDTCPVCGAPKPSVVPTDKETVQADLVDLSTQEGRQLAKANLNPYGKGWKTTYEIVQAQIDTGKRKAKNPLYSTAMMMVRQGKWLNTGELEQAANELDISFHAITVAVDWARKKYRPTKMTFNF